LLLFKAREWSVSSAELGKSRMIRSETASIASPPTPTDGDYYMHAPTVEALASLA